MPAGVVNNLAPLAIGGKAPFTFTFTVTGTLTVGTGKARMPVHRPITIANIRANCGTAPTGAAILIDVNKNGTTLFTTQGNRTSIAVSGFADTASTPDVTTATTDDYITVDIDQIGSTIAGADLTVTIEYY